MKTIRFYIKGDFQDGYLYGGQLFLIENGGELKTIPLWDIITQHIYPGSEEHDFFKIIFSQNNWLKNEQGKSFFSIKQFKEGFDKLWRKYTNIEYEFTMDKSEPKVLQTLESVPVFDMQVYGMRLFIGNRQGLYESGFSINDDNSVHLNEKIERVFDAKTTNINAKSGSVMISSNSDGLFHGQMVEIGSRLKVKPKPVSKNSLRSGWSGYDVLNYESQRNFDYLKSAFSRTEERKYLYKDEANTNKISIDDVGTEAYSLHDLLSNSRIDEENIVYSFNSSNNCFFFLNDGSLKGLSFRKDNKDSPVKLSSTDFLLPKGVTKSNMAIKPISTKIVPNGCVIEYFDQVILMYNGKKSVLEDNSVISIKTFPGSIRYKNIIAIFDGSGVAIHSMYPF
ncbi:hypothetical protein [Mucilaginibacter celer]|uniref:Uncharacterized protein n=1 Tax=Mucilaginibacter celer TaxID=2305508 RepID=A0A494VUQ2_9SPHI|nr:hypothetical protein [Mucilaginibacter celer]AYL98724.1 hypothetical protein HYN43_027155 [Mucilaginibacter celer]